MRRILLTLALAIAAGWMAPSAHAQQQTQLINPSAAVIPAANTTASVVGGSIRGLGQAVAGTLEDNAIIRSLNRLFGRTITTPTQPGFSPLPVPEAYQSTKYPNAFRPAMPVMSTFGSNPTVIFPK
jgi:hypothetical protein